jgi:hypothetical protein
MQNAETRILNQTLINGITSRDNNLQKEAADGMNTYLRIRMREDGFARRIINPDTVTEANLDRQVDTAKPTIVRDKEPNSPGAYSVPFGTSPMGHYIRGPRYRVMFDRLISRRFTADVNTLLTYDMDIRQILNDFILKDIMGEEDRNFIAVADYIVGTLNTPNADLGSCQNLQVGSMSRTNLAYSMKGMPQTNRHLNAAVALVNNITIWDIVAFGRDDVGGNLAEEMFINGFGERQIMGLKWIVTIKTDLVPNDVIYHFAEKKYTGDFFILDDITVSTKNENYMIEFFGYECVGAAIANSAAVVRSQFDGTQRDWITGL